MTVIVLTLTDCPPSLRGEITRWLLEIDTGVYVGRVSARVRDQIWQRVVNESSKGRAIMVFSSGEGEQRLDFRTHHSDWEPIDFDGLKLMLRPSSSWLSRRNSPHDMALKEGFSKAAKIRAAKRMSRKGRIHHALDRYIILDVETTGLSPDQHDIIEIGAVKVSNQQVESTFQALVKIEGKIPQQVVQLTGISDDLLQSEGRPIHEALQEFLVYIDDWPIVAHNGDFDYSFIRAACIKLGFPPINNKRIDTMSLARRYLVEVPNYKLETLVEYLNIPVTGLHRSLNDCFATMQLYQQLNKIQENGL
jgi:CRISPR-associated protein Cas2